MCQWLSMINTPQLVKKLENFTPGFGPVWLEWLKVDEEYGDGDAPSLHAVFSEYSHFIVACIEELELTTKIQLLQFIEESLVSEDEDLSNAVATCFLENLVQMNKYYNPESYFPYLGKKSRQYTKSWDEFNGMRTKGLW